MCFIDIQEILYSILSVNNVLFMHKAHTIYIRVALKSIYIALLLVCSTVKVFSDKTVNY